MKITIEKLLDYLQCPMAYRHRYIKNTQPLSNHKNLNEQTMNDLFDKEIHKLAYHVFNYIQDNRYPTQYILRQKWGKLWCKDKTVEDIVTESTDRMSLRTQFGKRFEKKGLDVIETIHPKFKESPGYPLLVGKRAIVKIGKHELEVTIDLVREVLVDGEPIIELMDFQSGIKTKGKLDNRPMNLHIRRDLALTAASLALRQLIGMNEDRIVYYDIINDKEYITNRNENSYKELEHVLDHVEKAIEADIFFPVMNDRCFECAFQVMCNRQSWYEGSE